MEHYLLYLIKAVCQYVSAQVPCTRQDCLSKAVFKMGLKQCFVNLFVFQLASFGLNGLPYSIQILFLYMGISEVASFYPSFLQFLFFFIVSIPLSTPSNLVKNLAFSHTSVFSVCTFHINGTNKQQLLFY